MAGHSATVQWSRNGAAFVDNRYSRAHLWLFDGGPAIAASSSPQVVPVPMSEPEAVDPEEAFVASLASCHMLWFLSIAAKRGFVVEHYQDVAVGVIAKAANGRLAISEVTLSPKTSFNGALQPSLDELTAMHHLAHENCFIANSVNCQIHCKPSLG